MGFLDTWYGIALFAAFDLVALILIICITYRWFFKRALDILSSGVCLLATSPLFLIGWLCSRAAVKQGRAENAICRTEYVGKKGKKIVLHSFAAKKLRALPRLADVFCGRLSFIGVKPFTACDCAFLDETEEDRMLVRAGLINPLVLCGDKDTDYDDMIESDKKYARQFSFFKDCRIFFVWLLKKIRGEGDGYLGKTRNVSYAQSLLDEERITREDYDAACG